MKILLLSTYEMGHQPLMLARPAAHLAAAGHDVLCQDLAIEPLDVARVTWAQLICISVPMHTATRLGVAVADRIRTLNPTAHICFYGLYALLHRELLVRSGGESVIGGEVEQPLVELAECLARGDAIDSEASAVAFFGRQQHLLPRRDLLPPLDRYARLDDGTSRKLVGYVEASRGCAHRCLHCPITPVYGGRLRIVQEEIVVQDIRQLVESGAEHITFGDPDFLNGVRHSLRIVERMHEEFPWLTFDATVKVQHVIEHASELTRLRGLGCIFLVSAVESLDDRVLDHLRKGHTAGDAVRAVKLARDAGIEIRPTFVAFTPWTTPETYGEMLKFVERLDLVSNVDPIQYAIRLLLPMGSSLLEEPALEPLLGPFDPSALSHTWRFADSRMERLAAEVTSSIAAVARRADVQPLDGFLAARRIVDVELGTALAAEYERGLAVGSLRVAPRLTEPWFC